MATHYRLTPSRSYCDSNATSYPDFYMAGSDGNHFSSEDAAIDAAGDLDNDVDWEVIEVDGELPENVA